MLLLDDGWACKTRRRRGQGTGRMSYLKDVSRRYAFLFSLYILTREISICLKC